MRALHLVVALSVAFLAALGTPPAAAQAFSNCQAIAGLMPGARFLRVAMPVAGEAAYEVEITYAGHSTFRIIAPDGTTFATDYAGYAGVGPLPDVVTMNHAHSSHWTPYPDPGIAHVLRGWNPQGGPAEHFLTVGETLVRNVTTDIRSYGGVEADGNSIFIFEIAGLCIGHMGHLHQELSDAQVAEIGRLDIVFVPIDGSATMNHAAMMEVVKRLRASIVIPMHWFSSFTVNQFIARTRDYGLAVEISGEPTIRVSLNSLPSMPTLTVLPPQFGL